LPTAFSLALAFVSVCSPSVSGFEQWFPLDAAFGRALIRSGGATTRKPSVAPLAVRVHYQDVADLLQETSDTVVQRLDVGGSALIPTPSTKRSATAEPRKRPRILVVDDQLDILTALELLLKMSGYQTESVDSPPRALESIGGQPFDLVLMDLNYTRDTTSGQEGLALLTELRKRFDKLPIVVMTAWGNVELAVEAMRLGASDFVQKPWDNSRLLQTITKELARAAAARRVVDSTKSELDIARHVQQKLFPQKLKPLPTLDYAGRCVPARAVGGDYYDFFDLSEGRLAGVLADVSGKGVGAAMLMANLQASFRSQIESGTRDPADLLAAVNRLFYEATPPEQYVTLFYFDYDEATRNMRFVNCGHLSPVLIKASGEAERFASTSTVVGLFPRWQCTTGSATFGPGDRLFAFTDGATDFALAGKHDEVSELGEDAFVELLLASSSATADGAVEEIQARLAQLGGGQDLVDDQTLIVLVGR
jgi:phosphoserine phosphatase RsbU/P